MDERSLQDILGRTVEVPDMVDERLEQTYARLEGRRHTPRRRGLRAVRTVLVAAALIAALCATATAAYNIFRQEVEVDRPQLVQGILGAGQHAWERTEVYNEYGKLQYYWPDRDAAPVDEGQAQALLGDYLPESGYRWQIQDYTFTVEGYVLDEHTGSARFYWSVEHPGGFPEGSVDWVTGTLSYKSRINVLFTTKSDVHWKWLSGKTIFVDVERSTPEKLYLMEGAASPRGWRAEDGLNVTFKIVGETDRDDDVLSATLELPGVKSLPVVEIAHPETGELAAAVSPIAVRVDARYSRYVLPDGSGATGDVHELVLEYADGSSYVVESSDVDNTDYGMYDHDNYLVLVFNRLVDPSQVAAIVVDGYRYEVG